MNKEGWTYLINSTKWHYFVDNRSLCGRWALWGNDELELGKDDSPDNCKACMSKLAKRKGQKIKESEK